PSKLPPSAPLGPLEGVVVTIAPPSSSTAPVVDEVVLAFLPVDSIASESFSVGPPSNAVEAPSVPCSPGSDWTQLASSQQRLASLHPTVAIAPTVHVKRSLQEVRYSEAGIDLRFSIIPPSVNIHLHFAEGC